MELPKKPLALRIDSERLTEMLFGWISVVLSECSALVPVALHPVRGPFCQRGRGQPAPVSSSFAFLLALFRLVFRTVHMCRRALITSIAAVRH